MLLPAADIADKINTKKENRRICPHTLLLIIVIEKRGLQVYEM
jgi:hypothetical protein